MPYINCERIFSHQHCTSCPGLSDSECLTHPIPVCLSLSPHPHPSFPQSQDLPLFPPLTPSSLSSPLSLFPSGSELGFSVWLGLRLLQRKGWVCQDGSAGQISCAITYTHLTPEPSTTLRSLLSPTELHGAWAPRRVLPSFTSNPQALWACLPETKISKSDGGSPRDSQWATKDSQAKGTQNGRGWVRLLPGRPAS